MSDELDLNISNYELPEVESLLKVNAPYSLNDVLKNEKMIIKVISNDKNYNVEEGGGEKVNSFLL